MQTQRDDFTEEKYSQTLSQLCSEARASLLESNPSLQFANPNLYKAAHINKQKNKRNHSACKENENIPTTFNNSQILETQQNHLNNTQYNITAVPNNSTFHSNSAIEISSARNILKPSNTISTYDYDDDKTLDGAPLNFGISYFN